MTVRTRRGTTVLTLLLAAGLAGPGCSDREAAWDGTVRDSAGIEVVVNHGTPLWDDPGSGVFSEVLTIGTTGGEPPYMFGAIGDIAALSDGRVVAADAMHRHLRFFRPDGRWDTTVGGPGGGPEEFGAARLRMVVGPADTILVLDPGNQRAHVIGPDGRWAGSWRYAPDDGWMARAWDASPTGRIVSHMTRIPGTAGPGDTVDLVLVRGLDGSVRDTAGTVPASRVRQPSGSGLQFYLYAGEPAVALCPDNTLVAGRGDRYEIVRYDTAGAPVQIVRLEREPLPITDEERTFLRTRFREIYLENGFSPERVDQLVAGMHFTEAYPAFVTLDCGPGGSIWVMPVRPVRDLDPAEREDFWVGPYAEAAPRFEVFGRDGRYLGQVALPEGFWPFSFQRGLLYGRWRDSLEVEHVKAMAVEGLLSVPIQPQIGS